MQEASFKIGLRPKFLLLSQKPKEELFLQTMRLTNIYKT